VEGAPLGLFVNGTVGAAVTLTATSLHIVVMEKTYARVGANYASPLAPSRQDYNFTVAALTVAGYQSGGVIGGYPARESSLTLENSSHVSGLAGWRFSLEEREASIRGEKYDGPLYRVDLDEPHVLVQADGDATLRGAWAIKLRGMHISVDSDQGHQEFSTGDESTSPLTVTTRWVIVESEDLTASIRSDHSPIRAAFSSASVHWDGTAIVGVSSGNLARSGESYRIDPGVVALTGTLDASIVPGGSESSPVGVMMLSGDLQETTLGSAEVILHGSPSPWWPLLLGSVVVAGFAGGAVYGIAGRRKPSGAAVSTPPVAPSASRFDDMMKRCALAADQRDWAEALFWIRKASDEHPEDASLRKTEALYLELMGDLEAALGTYEVAALMGCEDALLDAALCAQRLGHDSLAISFAIRALDQVPEFADEIALDKGFRELRETTELKDAIARARPKIEPFDPESGHP
jgi:hypothetical protein